LASSKSLDKYLNKLVERYSSLFVLPSGKTLILLLLVMCSLGGTLAILPFMLSFNGLVVGLLFGLAIFFINVFSDILISFGFMKGDSIFNLRRCSGLSLFSSLGWFAVIFFGSLLSAVLKDSNIWLKGFLLSFCATLALRLLVFSSASFKGQARVFLSSFFPLVLSLFLVYFLNSVVGFNLSSSIIIFLSISIPMVILKPLLSHSKPQGTRKNISIKKQAEKMNPASASVNGISKAIDETKGE